MSDLSLSHPVRSLLQRGIIMPLPQAVYIDESVMPERIAPGVVFHPGTRLDGEGSSIGPGCVIGEEGPVHLDNCQLGHGVAFKAGYAQGAVFLDGASMGSGAHIRSGTVLEEEANIAHTVGLKQTLLLSYVTTGSLINFCDALMAGGTSRKHHSEIGSSYIHFNFTPHGDKATPSLIGDVPRGVLLDQAPIFLGGQGGLVGPTRIGYGVVIAAGVVQRKDALREGHLYAGAVARSQEPLVYPLGRYGSIERIVRNNLIYIGNIQALQQWYRLVRIRFMRRDPWREACRLGGLLQLDAIVKERIKRLQDMAEKMSASVALWQAEPPSDRRDALIRQQQAFATGWPGIRERLKQPVPESIGAEARSEFLTAWEQVTTEGYLSAVHTLPTKAKAAAQQWLQAVVDHASGGADLTLA